MLSRVAENLYWLARYIERVENTARLVNVQANLLMDLPRAHDGWHDMGWQHMLTIIGASDHFYDSYKDADERNIIAFMLVDKNNPGSILSSLIMARENLRATREALPQEAWEVLNEIYLFARNEAATILGRNRQFECLARIITEIHSLTGLLNSTMTRDMGYIFLQLGYYMERADMTSRILDVRSSHIFSVDEEPATIEDLIWVMVLRSLSAYQPYRRYARARVRGRTALAWLCQDQRFPRSIYYCFDQIESGVRLLPHHDQPLRLITQLKRHVQTSNMDTLSKNKNELRQYLDHMQQELEDLHQIIFDSYFCPEPVSPASQKQTSANVSVSSIHNSAANKQVQSQTSMPLKP